MRSASRIYNRVGAYVWPCLAVAAFVYAFAGTSQQHGVSTVAIVGLSAMSTVFGAVLIVRLLNPRENLLSIAGGALITLIMLVFTFSLLYYQTGAQGNWSVRLTHLDALLITFGTLTTAGANIQAKTELARGLLLAQMAADLVVVTGMVSLFLARAASRRGRPTSASDPHDAKP